MGPVPDGPPGAPAVEHRDLPSKGLFSFLMFIFTLMETGEKGTPPIVTIPAG